MSGEGIMGTAATDALTKLRSEYRDVAARAGELGVSVGPAHTVVIKLHTKMDGLRKSIRAGEQRIADSYANADQVAKARKTESASTMAPLDVEAGESSQDKVQRR